MYPNPQEALPLTARPNLEQYRKLAKDLVKACGSDEPEAVRAWATRWIRRLEPADRNVVVDRIAKFAHAHLSPSACTLTAAQFVIARAHGFLSWPRFAKHLDSLGRAGSSVSAYERAVDAIVAGDVEAVARLLRKYPSLVRTRSTREHRATLLHYVSANGVEGFRQVSPTNAAAIARMLLEAGADVDATADVYDGKCTALGLVATSSPPFAAGVQHDVIEVLLEHGARVDLRGSAGRDGLLVLGCLANGQPQAAEYLAKRGAPLDLRSAAGLGRLEVVTDLLARVSQDDIIGAFSLACAYGQAAVIDVLVQGGVNVDVELKDHGDGHTGLHLAAFHGQLDAVKTLLRHEARIDTIDKTWKTSPLEWALTGWQHSGHAGQYYDVVSAIVASGARVSPEIESWDKVRDDPKMLAVLKQ